MRPECNGDSKCFSSVSSAIYPRPIPNAIKAVEQRLQLSLASPPPSSLLSAPPIYLPPAALLLSTSFFPSLLLSSFHISQHHHLILHSSTTLIPASIASFLIFIHFPSLSIFSPLAISLTPAPCPPPHPLYLPLLYSLSLQPPIPKCLLQCKCEDGGSDTSRSTHSCPITSPE